MADEKISTTCGSAKNNDLRTFVIAFLTTVIVLALYHFGMGLCTIFGTANSCPQLPVINSYVLVPVSALPQQGPGMHHGMFRKGPHGMMKHDGRRFAPGMMKHPGKFGPNCPMMQCPGKPGPNCPMMQCPGKPGPKGPEMQCPGKPGPKGPEMQCPGKPGPKGPAPVKAPAPAPAK